jgi:hypothetical protein
MTLSIPPIPGLTRRMQLGLGNPGIDFIFDFTAKNIGWQPPS